MRRSRPEPEASPAWAVRPVAVDVRVVAATHRDLDEAMAAGAFREDLYYRLHVYRVEVPPLRARRADIPLLVEAALRRLSDRTPELGRAVLSPLAMRLLRAHDWPGNVRELFSVVESAVIRAGGGGRVEAQHLPEAIRDPEGRGRLPGREGRYRADEGDERATIVAALEEAEGSRVRAAELLGMSRTTLWRRMRSFGLHEDEEG